MLELYSRSDSRRSRGDCMRDSQCYVISSKGGNRNFSNGITECRNYGTALSIAWLRSIVLLTDIKKMYICHSLLAESKD